MNTSDILAISHLTGPCRFQSLLEYVETPLGKCPKALKAVLSKVPCSRHIFRMDVEASEQRREANAGTLALAGLPAQQGSEACNDGPKATLADQPRPAVISIASNGAAKSIFQGEASNCL